eukprot:Platyproteum_vivax@DN4793_c0_g1_i2.p1
MAFSAKIWATDGLYSHLNAFLAHAAPAKIVISSRTDYRDPAFLKVSLDYGTFSIHLKDHGIKSVIEHRCADGDTEACLIITSESYDMNIALVDVALRSFMRAPEQRIVQVFSWENTWHQRQAVWVSDHSPSKTQKRVANDVENFYKSAKFYHERKLVYQRGLILSGPSSSGKHWLIRHLSLTHQKSMCYLPITDVTYSSVGPAIACAPLGSIIVIDNLVQFYAHIPSPERAVFLRHLETVFNTSVNDPRGLLILCLTPLNIPPDLERFLLMPQRFQKKFELSLAGHQDIEQVILSKQPALPGEDCKKLAEKCTRSQVSENVLRWFYANTEAEAQENGKELAEQSAEEQQAVTQQLENLCIAVKDERTMIDVAGTASRDRLYS